MKTLLIIAVTVLLMPFLGRAQGWTSQKLEEIWLKSTKDNHFYTLNDCGGDTVVYLTKNFGFNKFFEGMTLTEVFNYDTAHFPFRTVIIKDCFRQHFVLCFFCQPVDEIRKKLHAGEEVFTVVCQLKEIDNPAAKEYIQLKKHFGIPAFTGELDKFLKIMGSQKLEATSVGLLDLEILLEWEPKLEI